MTLDEAKTEYGVLYPQDIAELQWLNAHDFYTVWAVDMLRGAARETYVNALEGIVNSRCEEAARARDFAELKTIALQSRIAYNDARVDAWGDGRPESTRWVKSTKKAARKKLGLVQQARDVQLRIDLRAIGDAADARCAALLTSLYIRVGAAATLQVTPVVAVKPRIDPDVVIKYPKEHIKWAAMHKRKGTTVCERWEDFGNFITDMGACPNGYSLRRRDWKASYNIDNTYWADVEDIKRQAAINNLQAD